MSVILDALKKLDREKSSRKKGMTNIAADVVTPDFTHTGKRIPNYIVTLGVVALAAAALTYGVMSKWFVSKPSAPVTRGVRDFSQQVASVSSDSRAQLKQTSQVPLNSAHQKAAPATPESAEASKLSTSATSKVTSASQPVPPASPEPAVPSNISPQVPVNRRNSGVIHTPAPSPRAPLNDAQEKMIRVPAKTGAPAEIKNRMDFKTPEETKGPSAPSRTNQDIPLRPAEAAPKKATDPTPNTSITNPASLKVSAIAWFEEPERRFAMINGIMANEGSSIDGIKVIEINPMSVRLLHDGQYFEISMSK